MLWQNGQQLNNRAYIVDRILRQGQFSVTYLAQEVRTNNYVAIKTLNPDAPELQQMSQEEREQYADKFKNEAVKLAKCEHPHIVQVRDEHFSERIQQGAFAKIPFPCIVMDYIDGSNLGERGEPQLPQKIALRYIKQIGSALIVVHQRNLFHLAIKPENIIIRAGKPEAVLTDFSLARSFYHPITNRVKIDEFSPPELNCNEEDKGPWTDVYSLAATLYVLLTGKKPEKALDCSNVNSKVHLTPPRKHNPKISQRVNDAIVHAMELKPEKRTQDIPQFLRELGVGGLSLRLPQWETPPLWLQLAGLAATIVGGIAAIIGLF